MGNFAGNFEPAPGQKFVSTNNRSVGRQKFFPFIVKFDNNMNYLDCQIIEANAETRVNDFCVHNNNLSLVGTFNENMTSANFKNFLIETTKGHSKTFI